MSAALIQEPELGPKRLDGVGLAFRIAAEAVVPLRHVEAVLAALPAVLHRAVLVQAREVRIPRVGTFVRRTRAARSITNPSTGERMQVPAHEQVSFRPAKALKAVIK